MSIATMIVLVVLIGVVGGIITNQQKARAKSAPAEAPDVEAHRREIAELKQRIAVLERIATDKSRRLASEIDALEKPDGTGNPEVKASEE